MSDGPTNEQVTSPADGSLCPTCGKALQQRPGSITAWVFGSSVCSCLSASPGAEPQFPTGKNQRQLQGYKLPSLGDQFDVLELVGIGGMGAVYKVADSEDNIFAIKVLRADLAPDPAKRKMFEREIDSARRLQHANLVSIYGFGATTDQLPFAAMEFVDGKSLSLILLTEGFLDLERALNLFIQIADGVAYAHSLGIAHLDLKPSNVIVRQNNRTETAKVVDFGIARMITTDTEHLTQAEEIMGSLPYMSPEQCRGEAPDFRSDVYSMGCLMYEVLTGKSAFQADNPVKTIMRHLTERPRGMRQTLLRLEVPQDLITSIEHCLEPQTDARYQLMDELLKDLQSVNTGETAVVAKQQWHDHQAKTGKTLTHQHTIVAVTILLIDALALAMLSPRDSVSQLIVLINGTLAFLCVVAWVWVFCWSLAQWKLIEERLKQSPYSWQGELPMFLALASFVASQIAVLPTVLSSCFVVTVTRILSPDDTALLHQIEILASAMQPALLLFGSVTAGMFLFCIYQRRTESLKWRHRKIASPNSKA